MGFLIWCWYSYFRYTIVLHNFSLDINQTTIIERNIAITWTFGSVTHKPDIRKLVAICSFKIYISLFLYIILWILIMSNTIMVSNIILSRIFDNFGRVINLTFIFLIRICNFFDVGTVFHVIKIKFKITIIQFG